MHSFAEELYAGSGMRGLRPLRPHSGTPKIYNSEFQAEKTLKQSLDQRIQGYMANLNKYAAFRK
jgi:hypothetical protein